MLTEIAIAKLPTPEKRKSYPVGVPGLNLIHQPSDAKSWALQYRWRGLPRKLTLGSYPTISLAVARRLARAALGRVAQGEDPARQKTEARRAAKAAAQAEADLVENVVALYVERQVKPHLRNGREVQLMLEREVAGRWKGRRLSTITRPEVHALCDSIIDRGKHVRANRVFANFRTMCRWAIRRGLIEKSPCEGLSRPAPETPRNRVLSDSELPLVWKAAESIGFPYGDVIRLLMLTGARRDEVAQMQWGELDLEAKVWTLPGARAKNKKEHLVPLPDAAVAIFAAAPRIGWSKYVFTLSGRAPINGFSDRKIGLDKTIAALNGGAPIAGWTVHDVRRSVATGLQKLGVKLEVTESVLNHRSGSRAGIVSVYQAHDYKEEKAAALAAWSRRLHEIVTGEPAPSNVRQLAARAS